MPIIQTIDNASQFRDAFHHAGRGTQFSYEALGLLFDYFDDMGENVELDVVAICCDFAEDSVESIAEAYSIDLDECNGDYYEMAATVRQYLEDEGAFIGETPSGFIYRQF